MSFGEQALGLSLSPRYFNKLDRVRLIKEGEEEERVTVGFGCAYIPWLSTTSHWVSIINSATWMSLMSTYLPVGAVKLN